MKRNKRWKVEQKLAIILKYLNDEQSMTSLAHEYNCTISLISFWEEKYNTQGVEELKHKGQKTTYTTKQKEKMIYEVLSDISESGFHEPMD